MKVKFIVAICIVVVVFTFLAVFMYNNFGGVPGIIPEQPDPAAVPDEIYTEPEQPLPAPEEPVISELDMRIAEMELLLWSDSSAENFLTLSGYYSEAGRIRMKRDTLERGYRLNSDEESFAELQNVVVNVLEENEIIRGLTEQLMYELSVKNHAGAAGIITDPGWFELMMPKMTQGQRNYYMDSPGGSGIIFMEIGFDAGSAKIPYTKIWYTDSNSGELTYILHSSDILLIDTVQITGGAFNGAFNTWLYSGEHNTVTIDTGTLTGGIVTGEYVSTVYTYGSGTLLMDLLAGAEEPETLSYSGTFGDDGKTLEESPHGIAEGSIAYAYNEEKTDYLYYTPVMDSGEGALDSDDPDAADIPAPVPPDAGSYVFDYEFLGLSEYPQFTPYTPVPQPEIQGIVEVDLSLVTVRIVDSVLEWFDGSTWHSLGDISVFLLSDPFYSIAGPDDDDASQADDSSSGSIAQFLRFTGRGKASVKPVATPKPARPPADSISSGGGGSSAPPPPDPTPAPPPPATPPPPPPPDAPQPGTGDGEDIDWSPDMP